MVYNHGYKIKTNHANADLVIVNTCGFIDSAKEESLKAINAALKTNGKVIVTGCLGANKKTISKSCPKVLAITGPSETNKVLRAVQKTFPKTNKPLRNFLSPSGVKLTPKHYSYLKISEGCNHKCRFCIIPDLRGKLKSLRIDQVLVEAKNLVKAGTKELLVISQDTSAYGLDLRSDHQPEKQSNIFALCEALGNLGVWIRLHYLYPYPHLSKIIPLMAQKKVLPYLDVPFQHSHPDVTGVAWSGRGKISRVDISIDGYGLAGAVWYGIGLGFVFGVKFIRVQEIIRYFKKKSKRSK